MEESKGHAPAEQRPADLTRDEEVVAYFVRKCASKKPLGRTHLMKLVYLADHECRRYLGRPLSDLQYYWHFFGPWDEKIINTIETLEEKGLVREEEVVFPTGKHGYEYKPGLANELYGTLQPIEIEILKYVCTTFADMKLANLLSDVVYETEPMKVAIAADAKGKPLDMTIVNGERHELYGITFEELYERIQEVRAGRVVPHAEAARRVRTFLTERAAA